MTFLNAYLDRLRLAGRASMAAGVEKTAERFCTEFLDGFDYCSGTSALLAGNVQSGKTGQMFGIMAAAADRDFFVFVILTTDNVLLQQQTLERVKRDMPDFCVCGEDDSVAFEVNDGVKPCAVVLKKNARTLRRWEKTFLTSRILAGNPLFIFDDEADAASLNAKVNEADVSAINRHIAAIRRNAASSVYLEVTGTPQSIFLQTDESGWRPQYVFAFEPGPGYLGGDFFFSSRAPISRSIGFIDLDPDPVRTFVARHLAASAVSLMNGAKASNALAHVSARTKDHDEVKDAVLRSLEDMKNGLLDQAVDAQISELEAASAAVFDRKAVNDFIRKKILPEVRVAVKNSKSDDSSDFSAGCSFIIGGNSLGRGVTIPRLNTVLYTRSANRPQADTIWQHNRIFGYDRDSKLIRVYLTKHLWKLLSGINDQNNSIYAQIESGISNVKISLPPEIAATRREVLDRSALSMLAGGVNHYPDAVKNKDAAGIDDLLKNIPDSGAEIRPLAFGREVLSHVISDDEAFSVSAYDGIFAQMLAENPDAQIALVVRRGRRVAQGTGALLSPNDWKLGEEFPALPVFTLYRIEGGLGWGADPVWVPNIRLPDNRVFFTMRS